MSKYMYASLVISKTTIVMIFNLLKSYIVLSPNASVVQYSNEDNEISETADLSGIGIGENDSLELYLSNGTYLEISHPHRIVLDLLKIPDKILIYNKNNKVEMEINIPSIDLKNKGA